MQVGDSFRNQLQYKDSLPASSYSFVEDRGVVCVARRSLMWLDGAQRRSQNKTNVRARVPGEPTESGEAGSIPQLRSGRRRSAACLACLGSARTIAPASLGVPPAVSRCTIDQRTDQSWFDGRPISRISPLCVRVARPRRLGRRGPGAYARRALPVRVSGGWLDTDQPFLYGLASLNDRSFGSSGGPGFRVAENREDSPVAGLWPW